MNYILNQEGMYLPTGGYHYYLKDHLGNTRIVVNTSGTGGTVVQQTDYYPFGMDIAVYNGGIENKYRYNGKEFQEDVINSKSLSWYDYGARFYDPLIGRWHTIDPFAEKYVDWNPYNYVGNNPILRIDLFGLDWYTDKDGSYQYDPDLNKKNSKDHLTEGQKYVGATYQVKNDKGDVTTDYRKDGSIFYTSEKDAYKRMWREANKESDMKNSKEQFAVVGESGVLVLPNYKNDNTTSQIEAYGYRFNGSDLIDPVSDSPFSTLATIHTHQDDLKYENGGWGFTAAPGYDDEIKFSRETIDKPFFTMGYDKGIHGKVGNRNGISSIKLPNGYNTVIDLLKGASLKLLLMSNKGKK